MCSFRCSATIAPREPLLCAEIGTWRGDFAATILSSRFPKQLHLIDPWEHRAEEKYDAAGYCGLTAGGQEDLEAIYQGVLDRFHSEIEGGRVLVQRLRSVDAANGFADESLDWVYVDGDHSYEGVTADLEAYCRTVKPGGFIAGDDYGLTGSWFGDGVTRAVDEFALRCTDLAIIGSQFLLPDAYLPGIPSGRYSRRR
jgi:hypothetical protein